MDTVISALNKQKFGDGLLCAEYKRDREDEQNIGPEDIDPLTLYVGNLAQEIIKEDLVAIYPKTRRIDIGFAKKMKFTRYAFVSFKSVDDCMEAFRKTHSTDLYARSLIVRFRRLHGTVGMPGEAKPQNATKKTQLDSVIELDESPVNHGGLLLAPPAAEVSTSRRLETPVVSEPETVADLTNGVDLNRVKEEPVEFGAVTPPPVEEEEDVKPPVSVSVKKESQPFSATDAAQIFARHKPFVQREVKEEKADGSMSRSASSSWDSSLPDSTSNTSVSSVKTEPSDYDIDSKNLRSFRAALIPHSLCCFWCACIA